MHMVFSSAIFLWLFLPIVFGMNYLITIIDKKYSNFFLVVASLIFYAWGEPRFVVLMLISIFINWFVGKLIDRGGQKRAALLIGIAINLLILGYYKYAKFFVQIINSISNRQVVPEPNVELPIGISFFTFQALSYLIDVYRGNTKAQNNLVNLALYISFFPQLIAGPIVKYKDINEQIENRIITGDRIAEGFRRFVYGLSKKVLVSNVLALSVDTIFSMNIDCISGITAWIGAILYTFQIYYDFSGYSDMAIGLGKMFGFDFLENFNYPYLSCSIREFWRRWHISLSTWFKQYVYIPLGGNRKGRIRTYVNLFIVFFLTGLWHGASYNFILWGLFHGFFSIIERPCEKLLNKSKILSWIYTFFVINIGWVLFRIENVRDAARIIKRMLLPWRYCVSSQSIGMLMDLRMILMLVCAVFGMGIIQKLPQLKKLKFSLLEACYCLLLFLLSISFIAGGTYNPFIYFRF